MEMVNIVEVVYFGFELDMLEAHIAEHRPNVQRLIVAEADKTSTGYPKPLYARDHWSRFEKYDVELVQLPTSKYRKLMPETNRPGFPPEGRLIFQEKISKRYMHARLTGKCDWVLHSDTDEIITDWSKVYDTLNTNPKCRNEWEHAAIVLKEASGYVNVGGGGCTTYRFAKSRDGFDPAYAAKHTPRGVISSSPIGWHFHMCCSSPREYYWKWMNRQDSWGHYSIPPSLEEMEPRIYEYLKGGEFYPHSDPVLDFTGKCFSVHNVVIDLADLPKFMRENIHLFPQRS